MSLLLITLFTFSLVLLGVVALGYCSTICLFDGLIL